MSARDAPQQCTLSDSSGADAIEAGGVSRSLDALQHSALSDSFGTDAIEAVAGGAAFPFAHPGTLNSPLSNAVGSTVACGATRSQEHVALPSSHSGPLISSPFSHPGVRNLPHPRPPKGGRRNDCVLRMMHASGRSSFVLHEGATMRDTFLERFSRDRPRFFC